MKTTRDERFRRADRLKAIRKHMGLSQPKFLITLGFSAKSYDKANWSRMENGFLNISPEISQLAEEKFALWALERKAELSAEINRIESLLNPQSI